MAGPSTIDPALLQFAETPKLRRIAEAVIREGSYRKAAKSLGLNKETIRQHILTIERRAAMRGWSPEHDMTKVLPDTHYLKGTSTLYDAEGNQILQWVKSNADLDKMKEVAEAIALSFFEPLPKRKVTPPPKVTDKDLLTCYTVADLHLGMYADGEETGGDNYDCDIAQDLATRALERLISRGDSTDECIIAQLGDWIHCQDNRNATAKSNNSLDIDTRWHRVARMSLTVYRTLIDMALQKHRVVHVKNVQGNHDGEAAFLIGLAIESAYANEPRVIVDNSATQYHYHRFGNSLLGFTHGHLCNPARLGDVMMDARPRDVGETKYRYWYTGHIHHDTKREFGWYTHESFRTIAPKDAWHALSGYRAGRDMTSITIHKDYGEWSRSRVCVEQLKAEAES